VSAGHLHAGRSAGGERERAEWCHVDRHDPLPGLRRDGAPHTAVPFLTTIRRDFPWLEPPPSLGGVTVFDVLAGTATQWEWAQAVWQAWSPQHNTIRTWLDQPGQT
jgi:hypothetical protein